MLGAAQQVICIKKKDGEKNTKSEKKNRKNWFPSQEKHELNRLRNKMEREEKERVEVKDGGGGWNRVEDGETERRTAE